MREAQLIMGMPIEIEVVSNDARAAVDEAFAYLVAVDERFSTYKETSEISKINRGEVALEGASPELREVFDLAQKTKEETHGYFDIKRPDLSAQAGGQLDHQLAARELLEIDPANTPLVLEHEYPKARLQDRERMAPILAGSLAFVRAIDAAAAAMYALQHDVLASQGIAVQGIGRESYRS